MKTDTEKTPRSTTYLGGMNIGMNDLFVNIMPAKLTSIWVGDEDLPEHMKFINMLGPEADKLPMVMFLSPWCEFESFYFLNGCSTHPDPLSVLVASVSLANQVYPDMSIEGPVMTGNPKLFPTLYGHKAMDLTVEGSKESKPEFWELVRQVRRFKGEGTVKDLAKHAQWSGTGYSVHIPNMTIKEGGYWV